MKHRFVLIAAACTLLPALASACWAGVPADGTRVGQWKTWVLASGSEIAVPPPPADNSDQTKKELDELRQFQAQRDDIGNTAIQFYNAVPATQRWHDELMAQWMASKLNANRLYRLVSIFHTALNDAVIAAYAAKYQYNRKRPSVLASDITTAPLINGYTVPSEPSYPSAHAVIAGTAVALLTAWFPTDAANLNAMSVELGQTRLAMGANYRSDIDAGMALGQAVAQKALARAAADGSDAVWNGTVPTGPGLWVGTNPVEPLEGQWQPWLLTRGDQFRPGPPPAADSTQTKAELALVKQITSNPTLSQRALASLAATASSWPAIPGPSYFYQPVFAVLQQAQEGPAHETRVLSLVAAALEDALISSWDSKYFYWRARPTMLDPTIVPLVANPNHPSYPDNNAVMQTALSAVMGYFYPQDQAAFRYRADELALARLYEGIQFPSDENTGSAMGQRLAALAIQRDQLNGP